MFYLSFIFALPVSIATTCFCVISGAGTLLDLLAVLSAFLLLVGTLLSTSALKRGSVLSILGISACGIVLLWSIAELVHAIPFRQQPGQISMLYVPAIFLGILVLHLVSILGRLKEAQNVNLMAELRKH